MSAQKRSTAVASAWMVGGALLGGTIGGLVGGLLGLIGMGIGVGLAVGVVVGLIGAAPALERDEPEESGR